MSERRGKLRRGVCLLVCVLLLFTLLPMSVAAGETEPKTVRAGWFEDSYNITGKDGERSGYGYEYQQSVAAYTGWSYE